MDTPGFDPNTVEKTFREIIRGVRSILPFARITGILYVTRIPEEQFDDFDRKLIQFIRALAGPQYIPRVTFITTFWTATPGQAASYRQRLASLRRRWEDGVGMRGLKTYQHGWEYNGAGDHSGAIIDWYISREQIARHAKEMIARHYSSPSIVRSRIEEELDANVPIHETHAGRLLLPAPAPAPSQSTASARAAEQPGPNASSHEGASSTNPPRATHPSTNTTQEQPATPSLVATAARVIFEGCSWFFRNVDLGNAAGGAGPRQRRAGGDLFSGGGEPSASFSIS